MNTNLNFQQEKVLDMLRRSYPRALSYKDIWIGILPLLGRTDRIDKSGGSMMRSLIKKNQVKKITTGLYCWIPT